VGAGEDQSAATADGAVCHRRSGSPDRDPGAAGDADISAKLLDSLGIPADERDFATLGGATRIAAGTKLPAPVGIFPRYIEPTAA